MKKPNYWKLPWAQLKANEVYRFALCAALAFAGHITAARAAIFVPVQDGDTGVAQVSIKDPTRVTVEGARIIRVIGDLFDASKNPSGRITVLPDEASGEVYVQPVKGEIVPFRPVKVDIKTDKGTYGLLLQPLDAPSDTIIVQPRGKATPKPRAGQESAAASYNPPTRGNVPEFASPNHLRNIKGWMVAMASNTAPERVEVRAVGQEVALWAETRFVLDDQWLGSGYVGERYTLTNVSGKQLVLDEREFYRRGVIAVAVQKMQVESGADTRVWVLRVRADNE